MNVVWEVIKELVYKVGQIIKDNLLNSSFVLRALLPIATFYIGLRLQTPEACQVMVATYLAVNFLIYLTREVANKLGKGLDIPVPRRRITEYDASMDAVTVETRRTEEMLLYLADLEDWLERMSLLKEQE